MISTSDPQVGKAYGPILYYALFTNHKLIIIIIIQRKCFPLKGFLGFKMAKPTFRKGCLVSFFLFSWTALKNMVVTVPSLFSPSYVPLLLYHIHKHPSWVGLGRILPFLILVPKSHILTRYFTRSSIQLEIELHPQHRQVWISSQ